MTENTLLSHWLHRNRYRPAGSSSGKRTLSVLARHAGILTPPMSRTRCCPGPSHASALDAGHTGTHAPLSARSRTGPPVSSSSTFEPLSNLTSTRLPGRYARFGTMATGSRAQTGEHAPNASVEDNAIVNRRTFWSPQYGEPPEAARQPHDEDPMTIQLRTLERLASFIHHDTRCFHAGRRCHEQRRDQHEFLVRNRQDCLGRGMPMAIHGPGLGRGSISVQAMTRHD